MATAGEGMLRLLSWNSVLSADKMGGQEVNFIPPCGHHAPIDLQKPPAKRRRPNTDVTVHTPQKLVPHGTPRVNAPPTPGPSPAVDYSAHSLPTPVLSAPPQKETTMDVSKTEAVSKSSRRIPEILSSQINHEILYKHNELRLIDQEIAKCQVALEQLRRCSETPYPTTQLSESVSRGRGSAVRSSRSVAQPQSPAPWGVTDGPYARHYAKWLIPDPLFDGGEAPARTGPKTTSGKMPAKGRSTRGTIDPASSTKGNRSSLKSLAGGLPQIKDKASAMIQKRKSDGIWVKLACLDCRRDNFSSAQGFINHCRIAHGRNFASHDAAADACGEPVDVDEAGAVISAEPPSASMAGLVHPLIYSAHTLKPPAPLPDKPVKSASVPVEKNNASFVASPLTPNLSTMLQKRGSGLDLQNLLHDLRTPVPDDEIIESESEDEDTSMPDAPFYGRHPQTATMQAPLRSPIPNFRPATSNNTIKTETPNPSPSLIKPDPYPNHEDAQPSPTIDSNQAPSLVDDDGDDDYDAPTPSSTTSSFDSTASHHDLDIKVEDTDTDLNDPTSDGPMTRTRCAADEFEGPKAQRSSARGRRTSALRRGQGKEEKHVSFVSPSPAPEGEGEAVNQRKRKRTSSVSLRGGGM